MLHADLYVPIDNKHPIGYRVLSSLFSVLMHLRTHAFSFEQLLTSKRIIHFTGVSHGHICVTTMLKIKNPLNFLLVKHCT